MDLSKYHQIIPSEHHPALQRDFSRIPDFTWLLSAPHPSEGKLQGDLLRDFPTVYLGKDEKVLSHRFTVMLLNNTCDLPEGRLDMVTVVPVVDFQKYVEFEGRSRSPESLRGHTDSIMKNEVTELFYLPSFGEFKEGALALLHQACTVSVSIYEEALRKEKRAASFTQSGFYFFLIKLTTHTARAETREVQR